MAVPKLSGLIAFACALVAGVLGALPGLASSKHAPTCDGGAVGTKKADKLVGTDGADRIRGGGGADLISGLAGDDCLSAGAGGDRIDAGAGKDRVIAGDGGDRLDAVDGERDKLRCGRGRDRVVADRRDRARGCERVKRRSPGSQSAGKPSFPTPATTGVPPGWTPTETRTADLHVTRPGAVVSDVLLQNADITVEAPNVTIRRVKLQGGVINNAPSSSCGTGLVIEQSTIEPAPGQDWGDDTEGVVSYGGYKADGVKIWHRSEGFRASECGAVRVQNSFALVTPPQPCGDWHGDGLQGYGAGPITVRNVTLELDMSGCDGTAPFFVPSDQGNTSVDVDRLLVKGGGYPFRNGVPGTVSGLKIAAESWVFGPVDVRCSALSHWDAEIVTLSPEYQITGHLRPQRCEGMGN